MTVRVLTGINTTGTLHLGNYCGAIRPCVRASRLPDTDSFFFMADLHALIKCQDPARVELSRMQIAASWLAAGLDPDHVTLYRQSDIPEIPQLNWLLNCVCSKGLMNRAHAYKAFVEANAAQSEDVDAGVSMGLYCYPILMAADILMFNADRVPVGKDQIQHLEMARDIATRFNNLYGRGKDFFRMPYEQIEKDIPVLPGLDGRKMSKSYNNVIPLFEGGAKALKDAISRVVTDSKLPGEAKDPDSTSLTQIFDAFATDCIEGEIGPMREKYAYYMSHAAELEDILQAGAAKARKISVPFLAALKEAVGLKSFVKTAAGTEKKTAAKKEKAALPTFKQYREKDGRFYFKFVAADGTLLLTSHGFDDGRSAGQAVGALKKGDLSALTDAQLADGVTEDAVKAALAALTAE